MTNKTPADLIVSARWILPVRPTGRLYEHCALVLQDGNIIEIVPTSGIDSQFDYQEHIDLPNQLLMPGLINMHGHAAMSLFRGLADDLPLMEWLQDHIWPAEGEWVDEQFVRDGTQLAMAEMLLSGTTCFSDMYFYPEAAAGAAFEAGMRAQINFPILDFPTQWGSGPEDYIHKGLKLHDNYRSVDLINIGFGPHAPYTVSDEPLKRIAVLAEELQAPIQIHMHETAQEVSDSIANFGVRPLQRIADLGLLGPATQLVHMTQIDDQDIELLTTYSAHVVHCPESNLKLASGFCPIHTLQEHGINTCLGTDGAASNNDLSLFDEMHTASLLGKGVAQRADALKSDTAIEMATINAATAMGLDNIIGSLEKGKRADFIAIDFSNLQQAPIYNLKSHLVNTHVSHLVTHVWVDGKCLVAERELQTLDTKDIYSKACAWQVKIQAQRASGK